MPCRSEAAASQHLPLASLIDHSTTVMLKAQLP